MLFEAGGLPGKVSYLPLACNKMFFRMAIHACCYIGDMFIHWSSFWGVQANGLMRPRNFSGPTFRKWLSLVAVQRGKRVIVAHAVPISPPQVPWVYLRHRWHDPLGSKSAALWFLMFIWQPCSLAYLSMLEIMCSHAFFFLGCGLRRGIPMHSI